MEKRIKKHIKYKIKNRRYTMSNFFWSENHEGKIRIRNKIMLQMIDLVNIKTHRNKKLETTLNCATLSSDSFIFEVGATDMLETVFRNSNLNVNFDCIEKEKSTYLSGFNKRPKNCNWD